MTIPTTGVNHWAQEGMFPAENVRIRCTIYIEQGGNRNTFCIEVTDLESGALIAQWVRPLRDHEQLADDLQHTSEALESHVRHHAHPFG